MIKNQSIFEFSEKQIEYIIQNFSKTSCRQIAKYLNNKSPIKSLKILPSKVFSVARLSRISVERKINKLIDNGSTEDAVKLRIKLEELLPRNKIGHSNVK